MRFSQRGAQKALSPYAQALKHVALRGGVALQSSAKEMELEMYRAGTLPADYRPPAQGKWDDTIERWAYAWQYPVSESDGGDAEVIASVVRHRDGFAHLLEFAHRLTQSPPSTAPGSGVQSMTYPLLLTASHSDRCIAPADEAESIESAVMHDTRQSSSPLTLSDETSNNYTNNHSPVPEQGSLSHEDIDSFQHAAINYPALEDSLRELTTVSAVVTTRKERSATDATHTNDPGLYHLSNNNTATNNDVSNDVATHADSVAAPSNSSSDPVDKPTGEDDLYGSERDGEQAQRCVMLVDEFSAHTQIPIAYLDDRSERSQASKELHHILSNLGLDYTEEGLIVAIGALASQHHSTAARAIFEFAAQVGLGPSAELYKARMRDCARRGDVNESMALIEEMKSRYQITPRIGNWHELMRAFHNARDYPAVSHIVDNMKMYANIEPNEVTFALQLRALGKDKSQLNSLAEAVQLFDQMEQVYGYIAARPHYDALMHALSQSPMPEMRLRCVELAQKMNLMGMTWNSTTYLNLIKSAQVVGDVAAVERYLGQMRDARLPMTMLHLSWAIQAHVQHVIRLDYEAMKLSDTKDSNNNSNNCDEDMNSSVCAMVNTWTHHMRVCFGIYDLAVRRGWHVQLPLLNALLRLCCQTTILCMEHVPEDACYRNHGNNVNHIIHGNDANMKDDPVMLGKAALVFRYEEAANEVWNVRFEQWQLTKDVYSYECYLALLAHQQRISEAEKLFQEMVMQSDLVPSRRSYECLIFMHLSSGEEGGAARALHYLEAMERAQITVRASLLKKMVRVNNAAGYRRDMKRRARRIMQAREEFLARRAEGVSFEQGMQTNSHTNTTHNHGNSGAGNGNNDYTGLGHSSTTESSSNSDGKDVLANWDVEHGQANALTTQVEHVDADGHPLPQPLPLPTHSTLAWWEKWKRESINKHELFDEEGADGTPKGESFAEKNEALAKMGIDSAFKTPQQVPNLQAHKLVPAIRAAEGGEMAGALWALDGGELSYPADGNGPNGWGVRLWRERAVLRKEYNKMIQTSGTTSSYSVSSLPNAQTSSSESLLDMNAPNAKGNSAISNVVPAFSNLGKATRVVGDQIDMEVSQAKSAGELSDWRQFTAHRYDDTQRTKPADEMAHPVAHSAELVWRAEAQDGLSAYKSDAEVAMENDNTFYAALESDAVSKTDAVVNILQSKQENALDVIGEGATRRSKYDYLAKWRDMYRHGTLEVSEDPLLRFGRSVEDHNQTMATSVRAWYERNKATPAAPAQLQEWRSEVAREREKRASRAALSKARRRMKRHK